MVGVNRSVECEGDEDRDERWLVRVKGRREATVMFVRND